MGFYGLLIMDRHSSMSGRVLVWASMALSSMLCQSRKAWRKSFLEEIIRSDDYPGALRPVSATTIFHRHR